MNQITFPQMYDYLSDVFETVAWSDCTCAEVGQSLIGRIAYDSDPANAQYTRHLYCARDTVEAMLHALCTLENYHNTAHLLDFSPLLPFLGSYDEGCTDSLLYLLACTGDRRWLDLIQREAARFPALSAEKYRQELLHRAEQASQS